MSYGIICDACKCVVPSGELQYVAADATIKTDKPEQLHICKQCARHMVRFIADYNEYKSGGIIDPEVDYIKFYLESLREFKRDGEEDGQPGE